MHRHYFERIAAAPRKTAQSGASFKRPKRQVLGHIAISSENNENHMLSMGKSLMIFNKIESLEEIGRKVEAITSGQLLEVANEVLDAEQAFLPDLSIKQRYDDS